MNLKLGDTSLIIAECLKEGLLRNQVAYILATAYHESAHTMKPISEYGGTSYLKSKKYYPFYGRGYVQLTWEANYKLAGTKLGVDFVKNPGLLLQAQYAVPILVHGMKEGWFTGKKLSDYIDLQHSDFLNARRMINSMDKADLIAGYAKEYDMDLAIAGYGVANPVPGQVIYVQPTPEVPAPVQPPLDHVPVQPPVASTGPTGLLGLIIMIAKAIFGRKK